MKLSDLVQFLNYLDQHDLSDAVVRSLDPVNSIASMISNSDVLSQLMKTPVDHNIHNVEQALTQFSHSVQALRQLILQQIVDLETEWFANSTRLFNVNMCNDSVEHIINRTISLSPTAAAMFAQRLKLHTTWQHAGLIFRPVHLTALHEIVALDPMYLVDTDDGLLASTTQQFTERYQQRVRNYVIDDYATDAMLSQLPQNQFGLVAAQSFLNFKPIEVINRIVTEVYDLLKPGGAFVFTYNNCDYAGAVRLAERYFACYTPGRLIKHTAAQLGYVINFEHNEINGVGIMELVKPGNKSSLRGGQTLALVKHVVAEPSDLPKGVDISLAKHYTKAERQHIQLCAIILGIGTEENMFNNYSVEKLDQLVTDCLNTPDFNRDKFQKRLDKLIHKRKNS